MHQLLPMLNQTMLDSPLHQAVTAVATTFGVLLSKDGRNASIPAKNYGRAVRGLRDAIVDTERSRDDDLLMTALMLDFCDSINIHFRVDPAGTKRRHQHGALALMQHRGSANFRNDASKAMMVSLQMGVLQEALHAKASVPDGCKSWFANPRMPHTPLTHLNGLTLQLADVLAMSRTFRVSRQQCDDSEEASSILRELSELDRELTMWYRELPEDCLPLFLKGDDVPPSIRKAGAYQGICSVYKGLHVANMLNMWRGRRVMLLHELRELKLLLHGIQPGLQTDEIEAVEDMIQWLADGICESVPFHLGDYTDSVPPVPYSGLIFPSATNFSRTVPESRVDHARHATGAGGWMLLGPLTNLCNYSTPHEGNRPIVLRKGQLQWIQNQLRRLQ